MKKLFLLAMLTIFQLPALMAQEMWASTDYTFDTYKFLDKEWSGTKWQEVYYDIHNGRYDRDKRDAYRDNIRRQYKGEDIIEEFAWLEYGGILEKSIGMLHTLHEDMLKSILDKHSGLYGIEEFGLTFKKLEKMAYSPYSEENEAFVKQVLTKCKEYAAKAQAQLYESQRVYWWAPVLPNDTIVSLSIVDGHDFQLNYKNGDYIVMNLLVDKLKPLMEEHHNKYEKIISGKITIQNMELPFEEDKGWCLKYEDGKKFIIDAWEPLRSRNINKPLNKMSGTLYYADGSSDRVYDGVLESVRREEEAKRAAEEEARQKALEEKIKAERKAEKDAALAETCKAIEGKYGKKMADAFKNGDFVKGMPEEVFRLMCQLHGITMKTSIRRSDGSVCYDLRVGVYALMGQDPDVGYVWFSNGKLSSWTLYR